MEIRQENGYVYNCGRITALYFRSKERYMRQQVKRGQSLRDESQNKTASKARRSIPTEKANVSFDNSPLKKVRLVLLKLRNLSVRRLFIASFESI